MDGQRFDDLTRRFGSARSRRSVLRGFGAAVLGGLGIGRLGGGDAGAAGNSDCAHWCSTYFSGADRGRCTSDAAHGRGVCSQCGPAAPANNGMQLCGGVCIAECPVPTESCHLRGVCDPGTRACTNPPAPAGTPCNDGNACTQTDACNGQGVCVGGNPVQCAAPDQCHDRGTCDPVTGTCSNPNKPDGTACNDGNACTSGDTCQAGVCTGGAAVACTTSNSCMTASCEPATGCRETPKPEGTSCGDGNVCNGDEACDGQGNCQGGTSVVVCAPCQTCNHATGTCEPDPSQAGHACPGDGNRCFGAYQCTESGACVGVQPVSCVALDHCHDAGVCDPSTGLCSNPDKPNGTSCDDGDACTVFDFCVDGVCQSHGEVSCPRDDTNPCWDPISVCNPSTGRCDFTPAPAGTPCSSLLTFPCTLSTCDGAGTCVEGPPACDAECQLCNGLANSCDNIPRQAQVVCDERRGYCDGGTCTYPCGDACKDACYLTFDAGGDFEGYLCCVDHLDAFGNCCWGSNQFGMVVDGVCISPTPPACCGDNSCPELCSFNRISRCC